MFIVKVKTIKLKLMNFWKIYLSQSIQRPWIVSLLLATSPRTLKHGSPLGRRMCNLLKVQPCSGTPFGCQLVVRWTLNSTKMKNSMKKTRNQYHYQIRKNRKMNDIIKKNRLLNACINNNGDIFDEIKKLRKAPTVPTMVDGVSYKIESHFANTYRQLYNSIEDDHNLTHVAEHLSKAIDSNSHPYRNDPINDFTSDCLINTPFALSEQLSLLFRQFLIHGHASPILMVSTLLPMIKDKLGDTWSSSNYRSIALTSLLLKIFDWILLLLFDEELKIDELQFGFKRNTSTTMCTWVAVETIDYFLRNGSDVFTCVMDMSKAFDLVQHGTLFWKLIDKKYHQYTWGFCLWCIVNSKPMWGGTVINLTRSL